MDGNFGLEEMIDNHFKSLAIPLEDLKRYHLNPGAYASVAAARSEDTY